jgi:hypothetical protein
VHDGADASASLWSRPRDEPVHEVRVHRQGFTDAELLHDDKAEAVHHAVRLVLVALEILEGCSFFVGSGPMDARELLAVKLVAQLYGFVVADLERECDRFRDHMISRQNVIPKPAILEFAEDLHDALMVGVPLGDQGEEEARIEEDHAFGRP